MDGRERTTADEVRIILDIRSLVLEEMAKANKEQKLLRDMQVCRMQPKDGEDWSGALKKAQADMEKAMGPDHSKTGIFVYHRCAYCDDGRLPCRQGAPNRCDNPRARND